MYWSRKSNVDGARTATGSSSKRSSLSQWVKGRLKSHGKKKKVRSAMVLHSLHRSGSRDRWEALMPDVAVRSAHIGLPCRHMSATISPFELLQQRAHQVALDGSFDGTRRRSRPAQLGMIEMDGSTSGSKMRFVPHSAIALYVLSLTQLIDIY